MLESFDQEVAATIDELGIREVWDPERVVLIHDHEVPPASADVATMYARSRQLARAFELSHVFDIGNHGICHQLFVEEGFALPGQLVVGNDSHATTYGALNVAARGIAEEVPWVLVEGSLWFRVPETVVIELTGVLDPAVSAKDMVLELARRLDLRVMLNRSVEFRGPAVEGLSIAGRMVLSNMGVDLGAKFALIAADTVTNAYLEGRARQPYEPVASDHDATVAARLTIDATGLEPLVAYPGSLAEVRPVREAGGVRIDQAFLGTCTNGRFEDLEAAAAILTGHRVHQDVRMIVTPASQTIFRQLHRTGLMDVFLDAGALVTHSTCGPCMGLHMGVLGNGEVCVSTGSRNTRGRMGSSDAQVYLASPATVAASAITGELTDPRDITHPHAKAP